MNTYTINWVANNTNSAISTAIENSCTNKLDEIKYDFLIGDRELKNIGRSVNPLINGIAKSLIKSATVERMNVMRSR